ncbi:MAG: hypothetical protein QXY78_03950 [Thermoplasmata archaeon]
MKHISRKIMHGVLDLLPILIIGVFAIYSHRHEPTQSITYAQNELFDFNQQLNKDNYPLTRTENGITFTNNGDGSITANGTATGNSDYLFVSHNNPIILNQSHKYLITGCPIGGGSTIYRLVIQNTTYVQTINDIGNGQIFTASFTNYYVFGRIGSGQAVSNFTFAPQLYDLTQIYGAGNEPTLVSDFTDDFPLQYYPYTLSEKILNKNVSEITYNDTDIGSQMVYALYKPIDKYFNLNKVANFEQVYDFFQVQFFNGNAPISIFIVWNIILYQFIMDVIFLVYMVFMFIIDFIGGMLDFMFRKSFGGAQ